MRTKLLVFLSVTLFIAVLYLSYRVIMLQKANDTYSNHIQVMTQVLQNLDAQRQYMNQMSSLANSLNNCTTDVCSKNIMNKWFELASKRESLDQQLTPVYGDMQVSAEKVQQFLK